MMVHVPRYLHVQTSCRREIIVCQFNLHNFQTVIFNVLLDGLGIA